MHDALGKVELREVPTSLSPVLRRLPLVPGRAALIVLLDSSVTRRELDRAVGEEESLVLRRDEALGLVRELREKVLTQGARHLYSFSLKRTLIVP